MRQGIKRLYPCATKCIRHKHYNSKINSCRKKVTKIDRKVL